jgi:hypothetical protein
MTVCMQLPRLSQRYTKTAVSHAFWGQNLSKTAISYSFANYTNYAYICSKQPAFLTALLFDLYSYVHLSVYHRRRLAFKCAGAECPSPPSLPSFPSLPSLPSLAASYVKGLSPRYKNCVGLKPPSPPQSRCLCCIRTSVCTTVTFVHLPI